MNILVLNSGSSSQKACVYQIGGNLPDDPPPALWKADVEWDGNRARVRVASPAETPPREDQRIVGSRRDAVERLLEDLWSGGAAGIPPKAIDVVGHRVVHGGPDYYEPARITPGVKQAIERVGKFAPLHYRAELEGMELVEKLLGRSRKWRFSIAVFIMRCRPKPQFILCRTNGMSAAFGGTDFMASITSTAPGARRGCSNATPTASRS